jgi:hypothetical protein
MQGGVGEITPNIKKIYVGTGTIVNNIITHTHTHTHTVKLIYIVAILICSCSKNLCLYIKSTLRVGEMLPPSTSFSEF